MIGVGDDKHGVGFDGNRVCLRHAEDRLPFGARWKIGDVLGCAIDVDARVVRYSLNGECEKLDWAIARSDLLIPLCTRRLV